MTVLELRKDYKVFVKHCRYYNVKVDDKMHLVGPFSRKEAEAYGYNHKEISPHGGTTLVEIYTRGGELLATGYAKCHTKDSFVRKLGLTKALGRAVGELQMINWTEILSEVGVDRLRSFCEGNLTRRDFERSGTASRRVIREYGVDEVRTRARKALSRRS